MVSEVDLSHQHPFAVVAPVKDSYSVLLTKLINTVQLKRPALDISAEGALGEPRVEDSFPHLFSIEHRIKRKHEPQTG